jgi:hypothetical protein
LTLDFLYSTITFLTDAPLAQLDRALDFGSSGRGFESLRARQPIQGVAITAAAPFSFDCEVIVKLTPGMNMAPPILYKRNRVTGRR